MGEFLNHNRSGVKYRQESIVERISIPIYEPLYLQLKAFIESIVEGKPALVSVMDGLHAMRLVERIRDSLGEPLYSAPETSLTPIA
jgi:predicted dehydrogenase